MGFKKNAVISEGLLLFTKFNASQQSSFSPVPCRKKKIEELKRRGDEGEEA